MQNFYNFEALKKMYIGLTTETSIYYNTSFFFVILMLAAYATILQNSKQKTKKLQNKVKIISTLITSVVSLVTLNLCLDCLNSHQLNVNQLINNLSSDVNMSDIIFLSLFTLITPISLFLLVRSEKFTTLFCSINFLLLLLIVIFLTSTKDLIALVMGYELLFLPAFFIMRRTIYSTAAQSAYSVFTVWSVLGSLIVVSGAVYLISVIGVNQFSNSKEIIVNMSEKEMFVASFLFFIGFGVKIPVWPFHYWLTRVHVEASTGFSIFLSGFLVKGAVYVYWKIITSLGLTGNNLLFSALCLFSVLDGSLKLATQTDIKKLVAFATVFEMGLIYLFLIWKPVTSFAYIYAFSFSHAFLSGLMFFLVEVIYSRTQTRSVDNMSGLSVYFANISKAVWFFLFIFWGLPFTLKFFVEFWVIINFYTSKTYFLLYLILFILFVSNVVVTKTWLQMIYGSPQQQYKSYDLNSWELLVIFYLVSLNTISSVFFTAWNL